MCLPLLSTMQSNASDQSRCVIGCCLVSFMCFQLHAAGA